MLDFPSFKSQILTNPEKIENYSLKKKPCQRGRSEEGGWEPRPRHFHSWRVGKIAPPRKKIQKYM